jgi:gas vesicle protein
MLTTLSIVVGALVGLAALIGGVIKAAKALWNAGASSHELISAVRDNTSATADLADELRTLRSDVTGELADHAQRITRLELHA